MRLVLLLALTLACGSRGNSDKTKQTQSSQSAKTAGISPSPLTAARAKALSNHLSNCHAKHAALIGQLAAEDTEISEHAKRLLSEYSGAATPLDAAIQDLLEAAMGESVSRVDNAVSNVEFAARMAQPDCYPRLD